MTVKNQYETSVSVKRQDGSSVDFVHMPGEVTIGVNNTDGSFTDITLSMTEAQELHKHLTSILG